MDKYDVRWQGLLCKMQAMIADNDVRRAEGSEPIWDANSFGMLASDFERLSDDAGRGRKA